MSGGGMTCPNGHRTTERDRFCAICGADVASAYAPYGQQPPTTPPWVVPVVAASGVVAVVAILVAVLLAVSGSDSDVEAGGASTTTASVQAVSTTLPVTTAPTTTPTTVPTTAAPPPTTARRTTTTMAVSVSGSCPAEVAAQSGDSSADALERFTTSGFVVTICWADGDYWYHGSDRNDDREIALPAEVTGAGFEAWSGDVRYWVGLDALVVTDGGEVILDEDVIRHDDLATMD